MTVSFNRLLAGPRVLVRRALACRPVSRGGIAVLALLGCTLAPAAASANYGYVYWQGFDHHGTKSYSTSMLESDFPGVTWNEGIKDWRGYLTTLRKDGSHALQIRYPKGTWGHDGGAQWAYPISGNHTDLYFEYHVRFKSGFDWALGGKLPGLGANEYKTTGGTLANGTNGFSARLMWRENGKAVAYVYRVNRPSGTTHGEDWEFKKNGNKVYFQRNKWHKVKMRVRLNTVRSNGSVVNNGRMICWLDGSKVLDKQNIRFRTTNSMKIDTMQFSTFFGGWGETWAPDQDAYAVFDNLHVFTWN